jgi:outer membrane immunogenic protein
MEKAVSTAAAVAAALFVFASAASAADMPVKAPPAPPAPVWSWTGLYTGVHVGGGWGTTSFLDNATAGIPPGSLENFNSLSGPLGGTQTGLRVQWGAFVLGVESTFSWADIDQTIPTGSLVHLGETDNFGIRYLYTAVGEAGFAWDRLLFYGKGGYGGGLANITITLPDIPSAASQSRHLSGWTAGAGLEYMLLQNLSLGVEYDHYDLSYGAAGAGTAASYTQLGGRVKIDSVVARVNIKSDWLSMLFR